MPTAATTTAAMDGVLTTWLNRKFVSDLEYRLQFQKFTMKGDVSEQQGNIVRFNEWAAPTRTGYATGSTALTEGTAHATAGNEITHITVTESPLTLAEYGEWIRVTKLYEMTAMPGTRERISKRLIDGASVCLDTVVRTAALTTTAQYCIATAAGAQTAAITPTACNAAAIFFGRKTLFDSLTTGFSGIAGHPEGQYAAIVTPKQELDITTEVTAGRVVWKDINLSGIPGPMGQGKALNGFMGSIYNVALYSTQNYSTATVTSASEIGYLLADGGLGSVSLGDTGARVILNDVNSPYKNVNSIAWHAYFVAGLLSATRVIKMYSLS